MANRRLIIQLKAPSIVVQDTSQTLALINLFRLFNKCVRVSPSSETESTEVYMTDECYSVVEDDLTANPIADALQISAASDDLTQTPTAEDMEISPYVHC